MDKILNLAVIANMITNFVLIERSLPRIVFVSAIAAVLTLLSGLILIAGFYALYVVLGYHMDPEYAALTVAGVIFLTAGGLIGVAAFQVGKIRKILNAPPTPLHPALPGLSHIALLSHAGSIVESFIAGLTTPRARRPLRD